MAAMMSRAFSFWPLAMATADEGSPDGAGSAEALTAAGVLVAAGGGVSSAAAGAGAGVAGGGSNSDRGRLREVVTRAACDDCG